MRSSVSSAPHLVWEDLTLSSPVIASCIGFASLFGFVWMVLVRFFAHFMVWTTVISLSAGCGIGAYYMWQQQLEMKASPRYGIDDLFTQQTDILYYAFFAVAGIGCLYTLIVIFLHQKIIIAVKVMKEASRAVAAQPATLLLPVLTLALSAGIIAACAVICTLLLSTGDLVRATPGFGHLYVPLSTCGWMALVVFGAMWMLCFVKHLQHAAIAGALSSWYFGEDGPGTSPCLGSFNRVLLRHIGTIAFGSLLITLLQAVRFVVIIIMKRLKGCAGDSSLAKLACCCVTCCLGCVERTVRYLSRNAYIIMMIHGTGFCTSASEAVGLLTKHMVKVAIVRSIGAGFLLLGKLFVAGCAASIGAFFLLTQPPYKEKLFSIVPAVIAITIGAWIVGTAFMSVYNVAVDTIFMCYALDLESAKNGQRVACPESISKMIQETGDGEASVEPSVGRGSSRRNISRQGSSEHTIYVGGLGEVKPAQLSEGTSTRQAAPSTIEINEATYYQGRQQHEYPASYVRR